MSSMRRSDPTRDGLSALIHSLGEVLGQVITDLEGKPTLAIEEKLRALAKASRLGDPIAAQQLQDSVAALSPEQAYEMAMAFTTYFELVNLAEESARTEILRQRRAQAHLPDGTPAVQAKLAQPYGLAVTADGTLYVADSQNHCVRRVTAQGTLETVAGCPTPGDGPDGAAATDAVLNEPRGLCLYGADILLISDHYNNRVRAVRI